MINDAQDNRNATRHVDDRVDYDFGPLDQSMRGQLDGTGWWLDTAALTPEATAAAITALASGQAPVTRTGQGPAVP
jgi:hypothetical protein